MRQTNNPGANHIRIIDYSLHITGADIHYQDLSLDQRNKQPAQHRLSRWNRGRQPAALLTALDSRRLRRNPLGHILKTWEWSNDW